MALFDTAVLTKMSHSAGVDGVYFAASEGGSLYQVDQLEARTVDKVVQLLAEHLENFRAGSSPFYVQAAKAYQAKVTKYLRGGFLGFGEDPVMVALDKRLQAALRGAGVYPPRSSLAGLGDCGSSCEDLFGMGASWSSQLIPASTVDRCPDVERALVTKVPGAELVSLGPGLNGVIFYPPGWDREDASSCILYNHGNFAWTSAATEGGKVRFCPGSLLETLEVPLVMYDYRGVALSRHGGGDQPFPTDQATLKEDAETALRFALHRFDKVHLWGTSLGGGLSTHALKTLCSGVEDLDGLRERVVLYNHDSFTTTVAVAVPDMGSVAHFVGHVGGVMIDAQSAMRSLIEKGFQVRVFYQKNDPVIRGSSRMGRWIESCPAFKDRPNVEVVSSSTGGHGNMTDAFKRALITWKNP